MFGGNLKLGVFVVNLVCYCLVFFCCVIKDELEIF